MKKRHFLQASIGMIGTGLFSQYFSRQNTAIAAPNQSFEVTKTPGEWKKILTPAQYHVLREQGTERAGTSPLDKEERKGNYVCAGCNLPVFSSKTKFHSGTGWPSFYAPIKGAVGTNIDNSFFMTRIEVHCNRCGGHLGHVFPDGPKPTGKRYCINGVALKFIPA
jgi:peptide-methionine (R)-S-oxide reductase